MPVSEPIPDGVACWGGTERDVETAYRQHSSRCYALAVRIVRDPHLAQDVIQHVFIALHSQPERFDPVRGSMPTWLMTLTHHKAVDMVRSQRRNSRLNTTVDMASLVADLAATPEESSVTNDERAKVRDALKVLNQAERQVILLAYFEGYSQSEIAASTSVPLGTVKSRTLSALRRLRRSLEIDLNGAVPAS